MSHTGRILSVDDDAAARTSLGEALALEGYTIQLAENGEEAINLSEQKEFDVVLTDLRMVGVDGLRVLRTIKQSRPETVLIVMTGFASMETVVDAISAGAYDYISKPFRLDHMRLKVRQAIEQSRLLRENRALKSRMQDQDLQGTIVGSSPAMVEVFKTVAKVAASDATVLLQGESGTGKELVARSIHRLGKRKERAFLAVNSTSVTENLLESELFGYVKGAFTGAMTSKRGIFETADRGTVFLDEIGDTSPSMQSKLLRVLESGEIMPVGSSTTIRVDVRIIAATNRDLDSMVSEGKFREDLYYRLKVVTIELPPLRDRLSDLPLLFDFFLKRYSSQTAKTLAIDPNVHPFLEAYSWPGNVRELENVIERAVALNTSGVFSVEDLPEEIRAARTSSGHPSPGGWMTLEQMEDEYIKQVLADTGGNMSRAAEILGIDRRTLYRKLEKAGDQTP